VAYLSLPGKVLVQVLRVQIQDHVGHAEPGKVLLLGLSTDFSPLFQLSHAHNCTRHSFRLCRTRTRASYSFQSKPEQKPACCSSLFRGNRSRWSISSQIVQLPWHSVVRWCEIQNYLHSTRAQTILPILRKNCQ